MLNFTLQQERWIDDIQCLILEPGIFVTRFTNEMHYTMRHVREIERYRASVSEIPMPHLVIACPGMTSDKEVRDYGADKKAYQYTSATAIVCNTLAHRILGNFFIKIQQPPVPTKMFATEEKAMSWLMKFVN